MIWVPMAAKAFNRCENTPRAALHCRCKRQRSGSADGSAPGHRRQDHERVVRADRGLEPLQHAHVLVVHVDVHVAVELAALREELALGGGVLLRERAQHVPDVAAVDGDFLLAPRGRAEDGWDLYGAHGAADY